MDFEHSKDILIYINSAQNTTQISEQFNKIENIRHNSNLNTFLNNQPMINNFPNGHFTTNEVNWNQIAQNGKDVGTGTTPAGLLKIHIDYGVDILKISPTK